MRSRGPGRYGSFKAIGLMGCTRALTTRDAEPLQVPHCASRYRLPAQPGFVGGWDTNATLYGVTTANRDAPSSICRAVTSTRWPHPGTHHPDSIMQAASRGACHRAVGYLGARWPQARSYCVSNVGDSIGDRRRDPLFGRRWAHGSFWVAHCRTRH